MVRLPRTSGSTPKAVSSKSNIGADTVVTTVRFDVASARIAAELKVETGTEVLVRERTMQTDDEVVALATSYFPRSLTRGTVIESTDTGSGGVTAALARLGHPIVQHVERVTAGIATEHEMRKFRLLDPPVVFRVVRITYGERYVLGVIHIVILADRFELMYELPKSADIEAS